MGGISLDKMSNRGAYRSGSLPKEAPLAMAYVPMQSSVTPSYDSGEALARGTLFPGLDLPFMHAINKPLPQTPLTELMAIGFVLDELTLYLDTHADDTEAFELYQSFLALKKEAHTRYTAKYGPVTTADLSGMQSYRWLCDPWPWDYRAGTEV